MCVVNPKKYVVLDVETNGARSLENDLLSISIYKPDDKKEYNRFLPLELEDIVWTTEINGITEEMLENKQPLSQEEFDSIIKDFELEERTILHFGRIDEYFIRNYLKRHKIKGFERLKFYNFKHDIISSSFSRGNVTKDNLCKVFEIENVRDIHTGINDCKLEWELFSKMNGRKLLVLQNTVYEMNKDYIIPVSYLTTYPNFKYYIEDFPKVNYELVEKYRYSIKSNGIKKFETNISGITIEHLINSMLNVKDVRMDNLKFQVENRRKLHQLGSLPSVVYEIPVVMNKNGTISAVREADKRKVEDVNHVTEIIKKEIDPLIEFIRTSIFNNGTIYSQEMVLNEKDNVLAVCDLSNESAILEIKSFKMNLNKIKYQLYYQSNNRKIYVLEMHWSKNELTFIIYKAENKTDNTSIHNNKDTELNRFQEKLNLKSNGKLLAVNYNGVNEELSVGCVDCGEVWKIRADVLLRRPYCPRCFMRRIFKKD